jgi:A/G-specific adenine glycosylase
MLGGMRALPDDRWNAGADGGGVPPYAGEWRSLGCVRHSFTHFHLEMDVVICRSNSGEGLGSGEWWPLARLGEAGLPTVFARGARLALAGRAGQEV